MPVGMGLPSHASPVRVPSIEALKPPSKRVPRSADVVTTALRIMGMEPHQFFIPGGYGEVVGLRKA